LFFHEWTRISTVYTSYINFDHKAMVESLKRGDEVITSGGIMGIVDRVMEDDRIEVTISENTKVQIIRSTVTSLLKKEEAKK